MGIIGGGGWWVGSATLSQTFNLIRTGNLLGRLEYQSATVVLLIFFGFEIY